MRCFKSAPRVGIRTYDQAINSRLRYHCATAEYTKIKTHPARHPRYLALARRIAECSTVISGTGAGRHCGRSATEKQEWKEQSISIIYFFATPRNREPFLNILRAY